MPSAGAPPSCATCHPKCCHWGPFPGCLTAIRIGISGIIQHSKRLTNASCNRWGAHQPELGVCHAAVAIRQMRVASRHQKGDSRHATHRRIAVPPAVRTGLIAVAREDISTVEAALLAITRRARAVSGSGRRCERPRLPLPRGVDCRNELIQSVPAAVYRAFLACFDPRDTAVNPPDIAHTEAKQSRNPMQRKNTNRR